MVQDQLPPCRISAPIKLGPFKFSLFQKYMYPYKVDGFPPSGGVTICEYGSPLRRRVMVPFRVMPVSIQIQAFSFISVIRDVS
jgi:hypothetical protein